MPSRSEREARHSRLSLAMMTNQLWAFEVERHSAQDKDEWPRSRSSLGLVVSSARRVGSFPWPTQICGFLLARNRSIVPSRPSIAAHFEIKWPNVIVKVQRHRIASRVARRAQGLPHRKLLDTLRCRSRASNSLAWTKTNSNLSQLGKTNRNPKHSRPD